ncbi:unnamed protein product [Amoebophrya sp. A25]|nr:unnamed protein product [Amoebophrya sp. A25]|eukprot:GSA25T00009277001.1
MDGEMDSNFALWDETNGEKWEGDLNTGGGEFSTHQSGALELLAQRGDVLFGNDDLIDRQADFLGQGNTYEGTVLNAKQQDEFIKKFASKLFDTQMPPDLREEVLSIARTTNPPYNIRETRSLAASIIKQMVEADNGGLPFKKPGNIAALLDAMKNNTLEDSHATALLQLTPLLEPLNKKSSAHSGARSKDAAAKLSICVDTHEERLRINQPEINAMKLQDRPFTNIMNTFTVFFLTLWKSFHFQTIEEAMKWCEMNQRLLNKFCMDVPPNIKNQKQLQKENKALRLLGCYLVKQIATHRDLPDKYAGLKSAIETNKLGMLRRAALEPLLPVFLEWETRASRECAIKCLRAVMQVMLYFVHFKSLSTIIDMFNAGHMHALSARRTAIKKKTDSLQKQLQLQEANPEGEGGINIKRESGGSDGMVHPRNLQDELSMPTPRDNMLYPANTPPDDSSAVLQGAAKRYAPSPSGVGPEAKRQDCNPSPERQAQLDAAMKAGTALQNATCTTMKEAQKLLGTKKAQKHFEQTTRELQGQADLEPEDVYLQGLDRQKAAADEDQDEDSDVEEEPVAPQLCEVKMIDVTDEVGQATQPRVKVVPMRTTNDPIRVANHQEFNLITPEEMDKILLERDLFTDIKNGTAAASTTTTTTTTTTSNKKQKWNYSMGGSRNQDYHSAAVPHLITIASESVYYLVGSALDLDPFKMTASTMMAMQERMEKNRIALVEAKEKKKREDEASVSFSTSGGDGPSAVTPSDLLSSNSKEDEVDLFLHKALSDERRASSESAATANRKSSIKIKQELLSSNKDASTSQCQAGLEEQEDGPNAEFPFGGADEPGIDSTPGPLISSPKEYQGRIYKPAASVVRMAIMGADELRKENYQKMMKLDIKKNKATSSTQAPLAYHPERQLLTDEHHSEIPAALEYRDADECPYYLPVQLRSRVIGGFKIDLSLAEWMPFIMGFEAAETCRPLLYIRHGTINRIVAAKIHPNVEIGFPEQESLLEAARNLAAFSRSLTSWPLETCTKFPNSCLDRFALKWGVLAGGLPLTRAVLTQREIVDYFLTSDELKSDLRQPFACLDQLSLTAKKDPLDWQILDWFKQCGQLKIEELAQHYRKDAAAKKLKGKAAKIVAARDITIIRLDAATTLSKGIIAMANATAKSTAADYNFPGQVADSVRKVQNLKEEITRSTSPYRGQVLAEVDANEKTMHNYRKINFEYLAGGIEKMEALRKEVAQIVPIQGIMGGQRLANNNSLTRLRHLYPNFEISLHQTATTAQGQMNQRSHFAKHVAEQRNNILDGTAIQSAAPGEVCTPPAQGGKAPGEEGSSPEEEADDLY